MDYVVHYDDLDFLIGSSTLVGDPELHSAWKQSSALANDAVRAPPCEHKAVTSLPRRFREHRNSMASSAALPAADGSSTASLTMLSKAEVSRGRISSSVPDSGAHINSTAPMLEGITPVRSEYSTSALVTSVPETAASPTGREAMSLLMLSQHGGSNSTGSRVGSRPLRPFKPLEPWLRDKVGRYCNSMPPGHADIISEVQHL